MYFSSLARSRSATEGGGRTKRKTEKTCGHLRMLSQCWREVLNPTQHRMKSAILPTKSTRCSSKLESLFCERDDARTNTTKQMKEQQGRPRSMGHCRSIRVFTSTACALSMRSISKDQNPYEHEEKFSEIALVIRAFFKVDTLCPYQRWRRTIRVKRPLRSSGTRGKTGKEQFLVRQESKRRSRMTNLLQAEWRIGE